MRATAFLVATIVGLAVPPAAEADDVDLSCEELAERQAARQFMEEDSARADRQAGQVRDSTLERDLLRLDAESYRRKVYEDCLRLRRRPTIGDTPAPSDG